MDSCILAPKISDNECAINMQGTRHKPRRSGKFYKREKTRVFSRLLFSNYFWFFGRRSWRGLMTPRVNDVGKLRVRRRDTVSQRNRSLSFSFCLLFLSPSWHEIEPKSRSESRERTRWKNLVTYRLLDTLRGLKQACTRVIFQVYCACIWQVVWLIYWSINALEIKILIN